MIKIHKALFATFLLFVAGSAEASLNGKSFTGIWTEKCKVVDNMPKNNLTQKQQVRLWEMYCDIHHGTFDKENFEDAQFKLIPYLEVGLGFEKIEEVFKKYGVIQLRELKAKDGFLIPGSGRPIIKHYDNHTYGAIEKFTTPFEALVAPVKLIASKGYDSVDPLMAQNASIIGFFGGQDFAELFPKGAYEKVLTTCEWDSCCRSIVDWNYECNWPRYTEPQKMKANLRRFVCHAMKKPTESLTVYQIRQSFTNFKEFETSKERYSVDVSQ